MLRKVVDINENKCNGCGLCVPSCAEGAIQIIDGKARLVSDVYCDGLGACLGECPQDAIHIVEREADSFDEVASKVHVEQNKELDSEKHHEHHEHKEHNEHTSHSGGCPGSRVRIFQENHNSVEPSIGSSDDIIFNIRSQLRQWPVQLALVPIQAPFFEDADLLVAADCVPFAYADFHPELLKGKRLLVGCPKLDDIGAYTEKMTKIFQQNHIKSITVAFMEVPCCSGLVRAVTQAVAASGKELPIDVIKISIDGKKM